MTPVELKTQIRRETVTSDASYQDAEMLVDVKEAIQQIAEAIIETDEHYFDVPSVWPLTANAREYQLPEDILGHISMVGAKLEGKVVTVNPIVLPPDFVLTEENIRTYFNNNTPRYFCRRDALYLLSGAVASEDEGLFVTYTVFPKSPANFTDTYDLSRPTDSTEVGIPKKFHKVLPYLVSRIFKQRKKIPLNDRENGLDAELADLADKFRKKDAREEWLFNQPSAEVRSFDNGFNL